MLLTDLPRDIPRPYLVQQAWQRFPEMRCLLSQVRPNKEEEGTQEDEKREVNNGNRQTSPPVHQFLNSRDGRIHQVGKKNREQKHNQGMPGNIQERQHQGKEQYGDQNAGCTCVDQRHRHLFVLRTGAA